MLKFGLICLICSFLQMSSSTSSIRLVQPNGVMLRVPYFNNETLADFKVRCNLHDKDAVYFRNKLLDTSLPEAGVRSNDILIAKESRVTFEKVKTKFASLSSLKQNEEKFVYDPPKHEVTVQIPNEMYDVMMQLSSANQSGILLGRREFVNNRSTYYVMGCVDTSEEESAIDLANDLELSILGCVLSAFDSQLVTFPLYLRNKTDIQDVITIRTIATSPTRKSHFLTKPSPQQALSLTLQAFVPTNYANKLNNEGKISSSVSSRVQLRHPIALDSISTTSLDPLLLLSPVRIVSSNSPFAMQHEFRNIRLNPAMFSVALTRLLYTAPIDVIRRILFDPYFLLQLKNNIDLSLYKMICNFVLERYSHVEELYVVDMLRSIFL